MILSGRKKVRNSPDDVALTILQIHLIAHSQHELKRKCNLQTVEE